MALAAGSVVIPGADLDIGQIQESMPLFGTVESSGGGSPPVSVVVDWEDGKRVTYADTQVAGSLGLIIEVVTPAGADLNGFIVNPVAGNAGGRYRGTVVATFGAALPDGTAIGDLVIVQCQTGFYLFRYADLVVAAAA